MATDIEYAQLAGRVYSASNINRTPVPLGWIEETWQPDTSTGFSAGVYRNGNEIVIAYTGTNEQKFTDFALANLPLGVGLPSPQLAASVAIYQATKKLFPDASISFTGHSLGGGLASIMGMLFDVPAFLFDPAPFKAAVISNLVLAPVSAQLALLGVADTSFARYTANRFGEYAKRLPNIRGAFLEGEALSYLRVVAPTVVSELAKIAVGNTALKSTVGGSVVLHSMTLLDAFRRSSSFLQACGAIPILLPLVFDGKLFDVDAPRNLMAHLYRHQTGVYLNTPEAAEMLSPDRMLDRFGTDFLKLEMLGGNEANPSAIIAAILKIGLQHYYQQINTQREFLADGIEGGIQFDLDRLLGDLDTPLDEIKGYSELKAEALGRISRESAASVSVDDILAQATIFIGSKRRMSIALNNEGLVVQLAFDQKRDFQLGGGGSDKLNGGGGEDLLFGSAGSDVLDGGAGDDKLYGGRDSDILKGGDDNDLLVGGDGSDSLIEGGDGDDDLYGDGKSEDDNSFAGIDTIEAGKGSDKIYGGDGKDTIFGDEGDDLLDGGYGVGDFLIGGAGNDAYRIKSRHGNDVILDEDGRGAVSFDDSALSGGKNRGPGGIEWFDDPDNPTYRYTSKEAVSRRGAGAGVELTVTNLKTGSAVFIDQFYNGDLGIELADGEKKNKKPPLPGMAEPSRPDTPPRNPGAANRGDPLVIDLTGAGLGAGATLGLAAGVHMDLDGDRFAETTGWVSASAGLLVIDRAATGNGAGGGAGSASDAPDGLLSDGQELFGDYTRLNGGQLAANGFQALSQHDRNRDGIIDARDAVWSQLRIATWGANPRTGEVLIGGDPGSAMVLAPLADFGIKAIRLANTLIEQPMADANGNTKTRQTVVEYTDGRTSEIAEYRFARDEGNTRFTDWIRESPDIAALPQLRLGGRVMDLHQALLRDADGGYLGQAPGALRAALQAFMATGTPAASGLTPGAVAAYPARDAAFDALFALWTGTGGIPVEQISGAINARHAAILEKIYGGSFSNASADQADAWEATYRSLRETYYGSLSAQTHFSAQFGAIDWQPNAALGRDYGQLGAAQAAYDTRLAAAAVAADPAAARAATMAEINEFGRVLRGLGFTRDTTYFALREHFVAADRDASFAFDAAGVPLTLRAGSNRAEAVRLPLASGDTIYAHGGDNVIYGNNSASQNVGGPQNDTFVGGAGNARYFAHEGDDVIDTGAGNDVVSNLSGNDVYIFRPGSGHDRVADYAGQDLLFIGGGLRRRHQDVRLRLRADGYAFTLNATGDEFLIVRPNLDAETTQKFGVDYVAFDDGSLIAIADFLLPGAGDDDLVGSQQADRIDALAGDDLVDGQAGDDTLDGGIGNDTLYGRGGDDLLIGGSGDDTIYAGLGDDQIDGGAGDDRIFAVTDASPGARYATLFTGSGNDTYRFGVGDGHDVIADRDLRSFATDTIAFKAGVGVGDVRLSALGFDLLITLSSGDSITVKDHFLENGGAIERLLFVDGSVIGAEALQNPTITGTAGNDRLIALPLGANTLEGLAGDDVLEGASQNDVLRGGAGNDILDGGLGADIYDGGAGDDLVIEVGSNLQSDVLSQDVLFFGRGDGHDIVSARNLVSYLNYNSFLTSFPLAEDIVRFRPGISAADLSFTGSLWSQVTGNLTETSTDITVHINGDDATLTLRAALGGESITETAAGGFGYTGFGFASWYAYGFGNTFGRFEFADGSVLTREQVTSEVRWVGTEGADRLATSHGGDRIDGLGGDDTIDGLAGDDRIDGGAGNDTILANGGSDTVFGGAGDDLIITTGYRFKSTYRNGVLVPDLDVVEGGPGDDSIGSGFALRNGRELDADTFLRNFQYSQVTAGDYDVVVRFGRGDGHDTVLLPNFRTESNDAIELRAGITPQDIRLQRDGRDLRLTIIDSGDSLTVKSWFDAIDLYGLAAPLPVYRVEQIRFAGGEIWDAERIRTLVLTGGEGADRLDGYHESGDLIIGNGGDDSAFGRRGDDTYDMGAGDDLVSDDDGANSFLFGRGDGHDVMTVGIDGALQTLRFKAGITVDDVAVRREQSLTLTIVDSGDSLVFASEVNLRVVFANGAVWNAAEIRARELLGTPGPDRISMRYAGAGVFDGMAGDDTLEDGSGDTTYRFGTGDGNDTITESGGFDRIEFKPGVVAGDLDFRAEGNDLVITLTGGDSLRISQGLAQTGYGERVGAIERLQFNDGSFISADGIAARLAVTDAASFIIGTEGDDSALDGNALDNSIYGLEGADLIAAGVGADTVDGGAGDDLVAGGLDNDALYGGDGADALMGDAGDDVAYGGPGDDTLDGGVGFDTLAGGNGHNHYRMGAGGGIDQLQINAATVAGHARYIDYPAAIDELFLEYNELPYANSEALVTLPYWQQEHQKLVAADPANPSALAGIPYAQYAGLVLAAQGITAGSARQLLDSLFDWLYKAEPQPGTDDIVFAPDAGVTRATLAVQVTGSTMTIGSAEGNLGFVVSTVQAGGSSYGGYGGFGDPNFGLRNVTLSDGGVLALDEVLSLADPGAIGIRFGNEADDTLIGSLARDTIYAGGGADRIDARNSDDTVYAGDGDDLIDAGFGDDFVAAGAGDDLIAGGPGSDLLSEDAGDDVYFAEAKSRRNEYAAPVDTIDGAGGGIDTLTWGIDQAGGYVTAQRLQGYLDAAGYLNLLVDGAAGPSGVARTRLAWFEPGSLEAASPARIERIQFIDADGRAQVFSLEALVAARLRILASASAAAPAALFGADAMLFAIDTLGIADGGDRAVSYAQGRGWNNPYFGPIAIGTSADERIAGSGQADLLEGAAGNDTIHGGAGSDRIDGGPGDDLAVGGDGWDTYVFNRGDGRLTIIDQGENTLAFGPGIAPDEIRLVSAGSVLEIHLGSPGDVVRVSGFNPAHARANIGIAQISFANGAPHLSFEQLLDLGFDHQGTPLGDVLVGTDVLDRISAADGDDVIVGEAGVDLLRGGRGSDVYVFNLGDAEGGDLLLDRDTEVDRNALRFGAGIDPASLALRFEGSELRLAYGDQGDVIRMPDVVPGDPARGLPFDRIEFADGSLASLAGLLALGVTIYGTPQGDGLTGGSGADTFVSHGADDMLAGGAGDDTYVIEIGGGIDTIIDSTAATDGNVVRFLQPQALGPQSLRISFDRAASLLLVQVAGTGDGVRLANFDPAHALDHRAVRSFVFGASGRTATFEQVLAQGLAVTGTSDADFLLGSDSNDRLAGEAGDDLLDGAGGGSLVAEGDQADGGAGDDVYVFNRGYGRLHIVEAAPLAPENTLVFGAGIVLADIRNNLRFSAPVADSGTPGRLRIGLGGGDEVVIDGFDPDDADNGPHGVEWFQFADGTRMAYRQLVQNTFVVQGDAEDNALTGTNLQDRLYGYEGDDELHGGASNDTFTGGPGDDLLDGGAGADMYVFNRGDGHDTIIDSGASFDGNFLSFGPGIAADQLIITHDGADLVIGYTASDSVRVRDFNPQAPVIRELRFAAGRSASIAELVNHAPLGGAAVPAQTVLQDRQFELLLPPAAFSDQDGEALRFGVALTDGSALPAWLGFDPATARFSGTPENADVGSLRIRVTATDGDGASAQSDFRIDILDRNDAPVLAAPFTDRGVAQGQAFSFALPAGAFREIDVGDTLTYTMTAAGGAPLPAWLGFDAANRTLSGTPGNRDVGVTQVSVVATDGSGAQASGTFTLTAVNVNDAPLAGRALAAQRAVQNAPFTFAVPADAFEDIDLGDSLLIFAGGADGRPLPAWLLYDVDAQSFSGTPGNDDVEVSAISLVALDRSGATATQSFGLTVADVNDLPFQVIPLDSQEARGGETFAFALPAQAFIDIDSGDSLSYSATLANGQPLPTWIDFNSATLVFSGAASRAQAGAVALKVIATDRAGASAAAQFELVIARVNQAPVAADDATTLDEDDANPASGNLLANDLDADGDPLVVSSAGVLTGSFGTLRLAADGAYTYRLDSAASGVQSLRAGQTALDRFDYIVSDGLISATGRIAVNIAGRNDAPVAAASVVAQSGRELQPIGFRLPLGTFTDIDSGDFLAYSATQVDPEGRESALPAWLAFDPLARAFSGTPGAADGGSYRIRVTARDSSLANASVIFNLDIADEACAGGNLLTGNSGANLLNGTDCDDTLNGMGGADTLFGGAGNDLLVFSVDGQWPQFGAYAVNDGSPGAAGSGQRVPLLGRRRTHDTFNGGAGIDTIVGSSGSDVLFLDDSVSPPGVAAPRIAGIEIVRMGDGDDIVDLTSNRFAIADILLDGGNGSDILWGSAGNDLLQGGAGQDQLDGGAGNDIGQGGDGNDVIGDRGGRNVFDGGSGNDIMTGGSAGSFFIGGRGTDFLNLGRGADVVAFNKGDGQDSVSSTSELSVNDTLSLGGGIRYGDLAMRKAGSDLVLETGSTNGVADQLTFRNWYGAPRSRSFLNMQVVAQAMADFDATAGDPLRDNKVETFDFVGITDRFDSERAGNPALTRWAIDRALAQFHISGSDAQAIGGDLAYYAGMQASLTGMALAAAQGALANPQFGSQAQGFASVSNLQGGGTKLA